MALFRRDGGDAAVLREDWVFLSPAEQARQVRVPYVASAALWLLAAAVVVAIAWAVISQVDVVARADARVIPEGRVQQIASLEGGLLRELKVREGQEVQAGEVLALLDPTRVEAQRDEGRARALALQATVARLEAEASGQVPRFPEALKAMPHLIQDETATWQARKRSLDDAVASTHGSAALIQRELSMSEQMAARGLMSDVEVMRLRRQLNDTRMGAQERINRFRLEASAELVRARTELTAMQAQNVVRTDALERATLVSPVRGLVKNIRMNTVGGVVAPGAPVMEIVPTGDSVLVEVRIKPDDIGFVKVGQRVEMRLAAYESVVYGSLHGRVLTIAPDAIGEGANGQQERDAAFYRALVRSDTPGLPHKKDMLPVRPGMVGVADIRVGHRSVASFVMRPMMKTGEAFKER